ncbi:hypothetical protein [Paenisporosarcina sp. TG20]|uniref:hypothetical protein n=1 Tax=Paenisporosarcina sp. TG20 TaxID=1211706 RepID=UPI000368FEF3|nr:hypothetical protein [Paenisporosarcina sp. TG20]
MFEFNDLWKFFFAFFLVLPLVTIVHQLGHMFFAHIFGGRVNMHIGSGKILIKVGPLHIRRLYFYDGWCEFITLTKRGLKWQLILIYAGGSIFNIGSILILNGLIFFREIDPNIFLYQFVYFSFYFVFFSLFPVWHGENPSDGMAVWNLIRNKAFNNNPKM